MLSIISAFPSAVSISTNGIKGGALRFAQCFCPAVKVKIFYFVFIFFANLTVLAFFLKLKCSPEKAKHYLN
jgi:hypothetical protein